MEWPHRHDFYSIVWFTESTGVNVIDFDELEIKDNRLFLMQPKQVHNWSYSQNSKGFILVFDKHLIKEILVDFPSCAYIDLSFESIQILKPLFENFIKECKTNDELSEKIIIQGVSYLLTQLQRLANNSLNNQRVKSEMMINFLQLVSNNIAKNLPVNDYANKLNMNVTKLNEICKEQYGENPKTIIIEKKITEAKRLLYFTNLSVKEIAFKLGFEDSSYFSRIFKQKTNLSPTEFKST